jgi:hypothetical protein
MNSHVQFGKTMNNTSNSPEVIGFAQQYGVADIIAAEASGIALQANCPCPGSGTVVRQLCRTVGFGIWASRK